jgi:type IV pilus assembly protein PilY1
MFRKLAALLIAFSTMVASLIANAQLAAIPPNIVSSTPRPMIMLNMSKDHQLFYRAYDEFSDLDGDALPESTYKHSFDYYGYFDSYKCYVYSSANSRFEPTALANSSKYCSGQWSGNFLNWATMARIDVLRKVLYGGFRSTDSATATVLERTHLPSDAHSFAKFYKGDDLDNLTPFTAAQLAPTATSSSSRALYYDSSRYGKYHNRRHNNNSRDAPDNSDPNSSTSCINDVVAAIGTTTVAFNCISFGVTYDANFDVNVGDQIQIEQTNNTSTYAIGVAVTVGSNSFTMVIEPSTMSGTGTNVINNWTVKNLTQISATICNTTLGSNSGANSLSHTNTNPPLMRIARGDFQLWNANERWQCYWSGEKSASNGNNVAITGLGSGSSNPAITRGVTISGSGPDFNVRVKVCDPTLLGRERCKQYPSGNYKPVGLLHEYGEGNLAEFALVTGSFRKNISGGVVRSNMQSFRNEVNYTTDGTFTAASGIVKNLDRLRIYGYRYDDGSYLGSSGDNCDYQLTSLTENSCTSWGNPIGEMYLESLKYLAGKTATSEFAYTSSGSKDAAMNLSQPTWVDPFLRSSTTERTSIEAAFGKAQCRPINILNFNASVTSYDHDQMTAFSALGTTTVPSLMNIIGADELIHGNSWFVGANGTNNNGICTAKTVGSLSDVRGICPDGPAYQGAYTLPALSYWARTNRIRADLPVAGNADNAFKVKTYSVSLAPGKPRIEVPHPSVTGRKVVIQPAYMLDKGGGNIGGGTLVDFRIIEQTSTRGKYLVIWEDSEQGGDYDQDASGILQYEVKDGKLYVYTQTFADATANPQGFGYTISGTDKDGVHFHSGILNFNYSDLTNLTVVRSDPGSSTTATHSNINASGGCSNCSKNQGYTRATYSFSNSAPAGVLQDPLWFAAKWGGFKDEPATGKPDAVAKWDSKKVDGTLGSDGVPDNYFIAYRADLLEQSLRSVFEDIINSSNTAPAVASAQITEGSLKYLAKFDGVDGHGELQAFEVLSDGTFATTPKWNAHEKLTIAGSSRQVITNVNGTGTAYLWSSFTDAQRTATFGGLDAAAQAKLEWVRGNRSNEDPSGHRFRKRNTTSIMGPVINSNPHVQAPPRADFTGSIFGGYSTFKTSKASRPGLIWVGAGDGMLHAFSSSTSSTGTFAGGTPVVSYVPGMLLDRSAAWASPSSASVQSLMEGTVFTGDVTTQESGTNTWATYLFGSLGRGGKGIFALDVTDTDQLTENRAASIFKWQFTASDDPDLGYTLYEGGAASRFSRQPGQIARMNNGKFAALFGNGVDSTSGKAALFILFAQGPASGSWAGRYVKLEAAAGAGNGLSQPMWIDTNGDGTADYIYAGDMKGNLWKFDVSSSNEASWGVAYQGKPLYTAKQADASTQTLPITAVTEFRFHPLGGQVVAFATGKAVVDADFPDTSGRTHGIYGIWDKPAFVSMTSGQLDTNLPRLKSQLAERTFTRLPDGTGYVSGSQIDWTTKKGWFINFPETSEMTLANPTVAQGLLAVVSVVPNAANSDNCYGLPSAYITFVDLITGLLDVNVAGQVTADGTTYNLASVPVSDQRITLSRDATQRCTSGQNCTRIIGEKTDRTVSAANRASRVFWREIPTFKTK